MNFFKKLIDSEYRELCRFEKIAEEVMALDSEYKALSDEELKNKTVEFREQLDNGVKLDDLIVPAFATVREAAYRVIGEKPYFVQIVGGLAIHFGNIAEMKTGEGKTLTETMPTYLNALTGKGVHIVTVNEFLAKRDSEWMGNIYRFLGLTVGLNLRELTPKEKQEAYNCDVLYSTNNEIGFDYLRDNMVIRKEDRVQRPLNFCIVDEVDSILIDEARTPLIISGGRFDSKNLYIDSDRAVKRLTEEDYDVDVKTKNVSLTEAGSKKIEKMFNLDNLYDIDNSALVHHINQALKANYGFSKDVDYVVSDDQVIIEETKTMATITFQNLFRMYNKLSGMTGTAKTEEEEFINIYNMYVIQIPTNKPIARVDLPDLVYATEKDKYHAIVNTIKEIHATGQPILVGTISVSANEKLSSMLKKEGLSHEVLNAKNNAREAEIIAKAGQKGAITIATNMAGRGTDIKLGEGVLELGGLYVIGTERHESRRIDNQLRGRSGRQGDVGTSQFFVSFEDDLMRRFGSGIDKIKDALIALGMTGDQAIRSKRFTKTIESAQRKVEGNNFDMRKSLLDYDNVMNQQREIIYKRRNALLDNDDVTPEIEETFTNNLIGLVDSHIAPEGYLTEQDKTDILEEVNNHLLTKTKITMDDIKNIKDHELANYFEGKIMDDYNDKLKEVPLEVISQFERMISLRVIDEAWVDHISTMEHLREGIGLRGYGQSNPLQAYTQEGFDLFDRMEDEIDRKISTFLLKAQISRSVEVQPKKQEVIANDGKEHTKSTPKKTKKVGRNDLCPCGSGKKYKNCCGK